MKIYVDISKVLCERTLTGVQRVAIEYLRELLKISENKNLPPGDKNLSVCAVSFEKRGLRGVEGRELAEFLERGAKRRPAADRGNYWLGFLGGWWDDICRNSFAHTRPTLKSRAIRSIIPLGRKGLMQKVFSDIWYKHFNSKSEIESLTNTNVLSSEKTILFVPGMPTRELKDWLENSAKNSEGGQPAKDIKSNTSAPKFSSTAIIINDLSALTNPQWARPKSVAGYPEYLRFAAGFDFVITPSEDTRRNLLDYWADQKITGGKTNEQVVVIEHGVQRPPVEFKNTPAPAKKLLCLGSLEARKNHLNLLLACERLWTEGEQFQLEIVGLRAKSGAAAVQKIRELRRKKRPVVWRGALSDAELEAAWTQAWALVYPSHEEGFGLPVAEALARGVPVVCGAGGALKERAREGGCEVLREVCAECLYFGIKNILREQRRAELAAEAGKIPVRSWEAASRELVRLWG